MLLVALSALVGVAWLPGRLPHLHASAPGIGSRTLRIVSSDVGGEYAEGEGDQTALFASLRARTLQIEETVATRWKSAQCTSKVALALNSWVRRLDVDWPRAAIGTSDGEVLLADLSSGEVLSRAENAHPARGGSERDMRLLHGDFDGGGLTAVALSGDCVVSAGRDGGARRWRMAPPTADRPEELQGVAELPTGGAIVSAIALGGAAAAGEGGKDAGDGSQSIWLACLDGRVHRFDGKPEATSCTLTLSTASAALCIALCERLNILAVGTADGGVECFRASDGEPCGQWRPLAFDGSKGYKGASARSLAIATVGTRTCLLVGGSDGALHMRYLTIATAEGDGPASDIFDVALPGSPLLPAHGGSCVALAPLQPSSSTSLLVSGAHDGTLRVWDLSSAVVPGESGVKALFGLGGYKVWLGSVWTDGRRIISDGRDNAVVVHDFSAEADGAEVMERS